MSTPRREFGGPAAVPPPLPRRVLAWTPSIKVWTQERSRAIGALYAWAAVCQLACCLYVLGSYLETYRLKDSKEAIYFALMTWGVAALLWLMVLFVKGVCVGLLGASVVVCVAGSLSFRLQRLAKFRYACALVSVVCLPAATMVGCRALGVMGTLRSQPLYEVMR